MTISTVQRRLLTNATSAAPATLPRLGATVLVALVAVLARIPSYFEPHHYSDEGIFAAVGYRLLQGFTLYNEAWDDKPPFVYWLYAGIMHVAGPSMPAVRLAAAAAAVTLSVGTLFLVTRTNGRGWGLTAGLACALIVATPFIEGNLALTELFAAAPVALGFALIVAATLPAGRGPRSDGCPQILPLTTRRAAAIAAAGSLIGAGFMFKQVASFDAAAAGLWLLLTGRSGVSRAAWLTAGFAATCAIVALVLLADGALGEGLHANFAFYQTYFVIGPVAPPVVRYGRLVPTITATILVLLLHRRATTGSLATLWLGWAAAGVLLSTRPYGHYVVQSVAPAAFALVVLAARRSFARADLPLLATAVIASGLIWLQMERYWFYYPAVRGDYYENTLAYFTGRRDRVSYQEHFTPRVSDQYAIIDVIRASEERTFFGWGEYPWVYPLAKASSPTRYLISYHSQFHDHAQSEIFNALKANPPKYIAWEIDEWRMLTGLSAFVDENYRVQGHYGRSILFERLTP